MEEIKMAKLKMKRLAYLLAACLLLLAALTGCSNTKTGNTGRTNGTTGTPATVWITMAAPAMAMAFPMAPGRITEPPTAAIAATVAPEPLPTPVI